MTLKNLHIDNTWSLFLDRDGVINKKLPDDYVKKWDEFEFLPGVLDALPILDKLFGKIFIVTNQQGIGKGLMTEVDLTKIHDQMIYEMILKGGRVNKIYHSPYKQEEKSVFRKPNIGMAKKAKIDFPVIDFQKSIMVGDSDSDMQFGKNAGMYTFFISKDKAKIEEYKEWIDFTFPDLKTMANKLNHI
jgi:D-glycero-D-manno-heptose 1,7-bisphosphate phosphatase